eukprot:GHVS01083682.1.p1 GENE.GHVS01083682.1~~GHVS01083682.1.p1  ORF type:complete len:600 (-),score=92.99 GHVS01083682.1:429-2228(-)
MEGAQGPSPHKRIAVAPAVFQNTFRFFGLGGYTSRIITGKRKEKALALASMKKSVSLGARQRELVAEGEVRGGVKRATTETLPMFEKNLVYHKHEAVHSADMLGSAGEAEVNEEGSNINNNGVLAIQDVFPLLADRDEIGATEFSPASSSSSPSFNANEMMALAGIRISGGPLSLEHHQHEEKFEATREVGEKVIVVNPPLDSLPPTTDSSTASENMAIPTIPVPPKTGGLLTPKATFPLEGPPSSPVPPTIVAPSIIDSPPITPDSSSTKKYYRHSRPISPSSPNRRPFFMPHSHALGGGSPVRTIISNVRGAVISRKQSRRKAMSERKQNIQMLREQRRRERDEKRDEVRKERERRKHRYDTNWLPIDEQTDADRKAHGLFDWPSWFDEPVDESPTVVDVVTPTDAPVSPLSLFWPIDEAVYRMDFTAGDISESLWDQCITDPRGMQGSWQVQLARSDSISPILEGLGVGRMKRSIVAAYPSVVKMSVLSSEPSHQPTIHMVTHLPMGITKQATIDFNGEEVTQADGDTGAWQTVPYFVRGRAMQRRVNAKGVMFDVRCALPSDPAGVIPGKVMLFQWTFIPHGKAPLVARRWLQMT